MNQYQKRSTSPSLAVTQAYQRELAGILNIFTDLTERKISSAITVDATKICFLNYAVSSADENNDYSKKTTMSLYPELDNLDPSS